MMNNYLRSRINWGVLLPMMGLSFILGGALYITLSLVRGAYIETPAAEATSPAVDTAPPMSEPEEPFQNLARIEVTVEDAERIASILMEQARVTRDARIEALEARIDELEESGR